MSPDTFDQSKSEICTSLETSVTRHCLALSLTNSASIVITDSLSGELIIVRRAGGRRRISIAAPASFTLTQEGRDQLDPTSIALGHFDLDHLVISHIETGERINVGTKINRRTRGSIFLIASHRFAIKRIRPHKPIPVFKEEQ